jgi:hypothetical protein
MTGFGYKLPSAGAADHGRFTPQIRHLRLDDHYWG